MCGIFGYIGKKFLNFRDVIKVLSSLQDQQLPDEKNPVGGHGAGILTLDKGKFELLKTGKKTEDLDPVKELSLLIRNNWKTRASNIILGHVRWSSPWFRDTIPFAECTQPYLSSCIDPEIEVACSHNGILSNYRNFINKNHHYQSEPYKIIDSEIYPHLLEDMINEGMPVEKIGEKLLKIIEGENAVSFIFRIRKEYYLLIIHKNVSRGLIIWHNDNKEILFCSREIPIMKHLTEFINENNFIKSHEILFNQEYNLSLLRNITGLVRHLRAIAVRFRKREFAFLLP